MVSSPSTMNNLEYEVFLSFSGADTRYSFTSHLHNALCKEGVKAFLHNKALKRGEEISATIFQVIEGSKISVVIFSQNYASSKFCLDELVKILECKRLRGQVVFPVFHAVDPVEVEKQTGSYWKSFCGYEAEFKEKMEKVEQWRVALGEAADLSGWNLCNRDEVEIIHEIVEHVLKKLNRGTFAKDRFECGLVFDPPQTQREFFPEKVLVGKNFQINLELIWAWLTLDNVPSIGIWGMGGVGKTTLVIRIYNKLLDKQEIFGRVYWVTVSQDFSVYKMQNLIAKVIGLDLETEEEVMKRAARMYNALLSTGKFVLILDDLWNQFDMKNVGIPFESDGCKLIVTTSSSVVCTRMRLQKLKKIEPLSEEEAWHLFTETLQDDLPVDIEPIAKSVARECDGLPLGIATMAGSMRGVNNVHEWNNALTELQRSEVRPEDIRDEVFRVLRFSYTRLKNCDLQQCFLYCSLFPEDCEIDREELIEILIAEGIIVRRMSRQMDFGKGHAMLNELVKVSLLEDITNENGPRCLKMHDLIRDMAIQIMEEFCPSIIEADRQLKHVPEEKYWTKDIVRISLMMNDIKEIPSNYSPMCSSLSTLLLYQNMELKSIPDYFFLQFQRLKVVDLSLTRIEKLPESVGCLGNLRALFLRGCFNLRDISSLVKLMSLEILDLYSCLALQQVPKGLTLLFNLTCLNLFGTGLNLQSGMLKGLCHLQFLAFNKHFEASSGVGAEELAELQKLESLNWCFHDFGEYNKYVRLVSNMQSGRLLTKYFISVGGTGLLEHARYADKPRSREVNFQGCYIGRELFIQNDLQILRMKDVTVHNGSGLCFKPAIKMDSFEAELKFLSVANCEGLEFLFDLSSFLSVLKILETLELGSLPKLHALFRNEEAPPRATPLQPCVATFSNLKRLIISRCGMKKLRSPRLFSNFQNVEEFVIESCSEMDVIIGATEDEACYGIGYSDLNTMAASDFGLSKLRNFTLEKLPKLKRICSEQIICNFLQQFTIRDCVELENIPISLPLPSLRTLNIRPEIWWESVQWGNPDQKNVLQPEF